MTAANALEEPFFDLGLEGLASLWYAFSVLGGPEIPLYYNCALTLGRQQGLSVIVLNIVVEWQTRVNEAYGVANHNTIHEIQSSQNS